MNAAAIIETITPLLSERGLFLVDVKISRDNDITVTIESSESSVDLNDCEAVNRLIVDTYDQDVEDYSLTVTSAGLDGEFKVPAQFAKAMGQKVEVWVKGGAKLVGTLQAVDGQGGITLDGRAFNSNEINKVKYHIEF